MKKVIVTGGAGFIGSNLSRELITKGFEVHIIDNLFAGKKENIPKGAIFHNTDIRDYSSVENIFASLSDIYCVFHLAALPRVQFSIDNPVESHDVNVNGTINILNLAKSNKVRRMVYSASSSAYGDQDVMPLTETMLPRPKSPYALQKYFGEVACFVYSEVYKLETVSLRYFNVYGPGQDPNGAYAMVIARFISQQENGDPMTITGDGEQTRDFTFVDDVVKANLLAMDSENVGKGEVLNIGYGKNISINKIADLIGGQKVYIKARLEPRDTLANTSLAREILHWEPKVSIEKGIEIIKKYEKR